MSIDLVAARDAIKTWLDGISLIASSSAYEDADVDPAMPTAQIWLDSFDTNQLGQSRGFVNGEFVYTLSWRIRIYVKLDPHGDVAAQQSTDAISVALLEALHASPFIDPAVFDEVAIPTITYEPLVGLNVPKILVEATLDTQLVANT